MGEYSRSNLSRSSKLLFSHNDFTGTARRRVTCSRHQGIIERTRAA